MQGEKIRIELEEAVGPENVSTDPGVLDGYAFQSFGNISDAMPWIHRPVAVALPSSVEEVQAVIRACGRHHLSSRPSRPDGEPMGGRAATGLSR